MIPKSSAIKNRTDEYLKTMFNAHAIFEHEIFSGHDLRFQFVYSEEYWHNRNHSASRNDRFHPNLTEIDAAGMTTMTTGGSSSAEGLRSFLTKLNYDIRDKYMFQALVRWDGSSKFSPGHRWGTFPSVSAAWRLSEENFFAPAHHVVNEFKIRASYGVVGNNSGTGRYDQKDTYDSYPYIFGDNKLAEGYAPNKLIDANFTWESTAMANVGLELAFLSHRLNMEMDYFDKLTTNMIRPGSVSSLLSGLSAPDRNIGKMRNRGFEINVEWNDRAGDFNYGVHINYSYIRNTLLKWNERLGRGDKAIGYPYEMIYAYKAVGIAQSWEDVAGAAYHNDNLAPGDLIMEDINGDGVISSADQIAFPNSMRYVPTSDFGITLKASWRGLDFSALFHGQMGRKNFWTDNFNRVNQTANVGYAFQEHHLDTWSLDNRDAFLPRLTTGNNGGYNQAKSTYWLFSNDFIRLRNLQIGYSFPERWIEKVRIDKARIYLSGENLFTITKWPGLDPEKMPRSDTEPPYPLIRSFSVGINLTM
jgi:TonB-linked SusC/RagA family outer membrane protein